MNNKLFWILFIIFTAAIAVILCINFSSNKKIEVAEVKEREVFVTQVQVKEEEADYCQALEKRVTDLENQFIELQKRIDDKPAPQTVAQVKKTRVPVEKPEPEPKPAPTPEPAERAPDKKANLSHISNVHGEIIFCVMANNDGGMHFPQYALERGVTFNGIRSNTTEDGNNWVVNPTQEIRGDYGITTDGTFFVSHEVIESTMGENLINLSIKAGFTGWQARDMTREGDYWIYKTR